MKGEIAAAVIFITRLIQKNNKLSGKLVKRFSERLSEALSERYANHWYSDEPTKGQGYRCIRINEFEPIDPVLQRVAEQCGINYDTLCLPQELTLWIDPCEVCCRFGENKGACCTIASFYDGVEENKAESIDIDMLIEQHNRLREHEMKIRAIGKRVNNNNQNRHNTVNVFKARMAAHLANESNNRNNNKLRTFHHHGHHQKLDQFHWQS
ncbi:protein BTG3-like [Tubulanus polymorphus]|uniref:protein BTG3-like n=1 Tax=Tubulanus polymorphus TaxID=672921 RepID=UPI003DA4427A